MKLFKKFIGDKAFYKMLFILVFPLIIQQGVTQFVSLLDNIMVGRLGTDAINSVAITNQLIFVFNLAIFGGVSGASIFGAQFAGINDHKGLRHTFRFKMIFGVIATTAAIAILLLWGEPLTMLFLDNETNAELDLTVVTQNARDYLHIMLIGLLPFMIVQVYASTLRELGDTVVPMIASVAAILVNLVFNYFLIFGTFGFPRLEVKGAAIATVMSRYVEMLVVVIYTHLRKSKFKFASGAYRSLYVPGKLVKDIAITGSPLMINEIVWSLGTTFINQCYSTKGTFAYAATNINSTAWNLFCTIMFAMGTAISIILGRELGKGEREKAIDLNRKLQFFNVAVHIVMGGLLVVVAKYIPLLYDVEPEVRDIASGLLVISGITIPMHSLVHGIYFAVRSGGKTIVTFLFDSGYTWAVPAVIAFLLVTFTNLGIVPVYLIVQISDSIKMTIGLIMLKSGFWANTIITKEKTA
ncbi:MAG: MATE family efflux transporter [Ruminococcaceae bacterium]|nr:MATE family efflux transporter [Oscillospiraceae bacterium]